MLWRPSHLNYSDFDFKQTNTCVQIINQRSRELHVTTGPTYNCTGGTLAQKILAQWESPTSANATTGPTTAAAAAAANAKIGSKHTDIAGQYAKSGDSGN